MFCIEITPNPVNVDKSLLHFFVGLFSWPTYRNAALTHARYLNDPYMSTHDHWDPKVLLSYTLLLFFHFRHTLLLLFFPNI